jgi:hypothetical protein
VRPGEAGRGGCMQVHSHFDERKVRHALGLLHKALILGTLGALAVLAPLKGGRLSQEEMGRGVARVEEMPELKGSKKVLWLSATALKQGHGGQL